MFANRKIHYLKDSTQFSQPEPVDIHSNTAFLKNSGYFCYKSIFRKIPVSNKDRADPQKRKFQHVWLSRMSVVTAEIVCSEAFRLLLGDPFTPKYRIYVDPDGNVKTVSRLLDNFTPWDDACAAMIAVKSEGAPLLNFRGDPDSDYGKRSIAYLKTAASLENFNRMLAVNLLFGKDDLHGGNWGIVEINGKRYAGSVDNERTFKWGIGIVSLLYISDHRKEQLLTIAFVTACRELIADYELKKPALMQLMTDCIKSIKSIIHVGISIDEAMRVLEYNKTCLIHLTWQIEAEIAIKRGDAMALQEALRQLPVAYFPADENCSIGSPIISMQNYRNGYLDLNNLSLRGFIKLRLFDDSDLEDHYYFENGVLQRGEKLALTSPEDVRIEKELLAVYDAVEQEKRSSLSRRP